MAEKLDGGAHFPELALQVGNDTLSLPQLQDTGFSIILFYRGHW